MPKYQYYLPARKLISQADSAIIERPNVPRSKFTNEFGRLMTFDAGKLYPFLVDEVIPGDHMKYNVTAYVRIGTLLFPMFSNQRVDTFFFFVPCRLLWTNWKRFMGEQPTGPGDSIAFTVPIQSGTPAVASLHDYMGIPCTGQLTESTDFNAMPLRAYNLIWNEWFRDQNIQDALTVDTGNGPDTTTYVVQYRAKSHDYFTSALPWPQKFTAPTVPVGGLAPVVGIGIDPAIQGSVNVSHTFRETPGISTAYPNYYDFSTVIAQNAAIRSNGANGDPAVYADLSLATGVAINTFRQAFLIQQLLERDARGGTRYVELIKSHFGVTSPDFRLQRPEYIGGGKSPLNVTPIAQTTPTGGGGLGALGAAGTAVGQHSASYAATEHGYIIGLINVRTELAYQQGLHRMWTRSTRYDFYWPSLAGLGEQAILRGEIYNTGAPANDTAVFGYQERWHELRTRYSDVAGLFRSTSAGTIHQWHLAQNFAPAPTLNTTFILDNPPMDRVLAAGGAATNMQYIADILIHRTAVRPVPTYGTPVLLGRF